MSSGLCILQSPFSHLIFKDLSMLIYTVCVWSCVCLYQSNLFIFEIDITLISIFHYLKNFDAINLYISDICEIVQRILLEANMHISFNPQIWGEQFSSIS